MRGAGWLLMAALSLPGVARGQSESAESKRAGPQAASVVRGEIGRATFVELAPTASFVLIELTKLEDGTVPDDAGWSQTWRRVPYSPERCGLVWTMLSSKDPGFAKLATDLVGKQVDGITLRVDTNEATPPKRAAFCAIVDGSAGILGVPTIPPPRIGDVPLARTDAALKALGLARDFFGTPDALAGYGKGSPLDSTIQDALKDNKSPYALIFALERRMYFFAEYSHFHWRKNPENFALIESELYERPWLEGDFRTESELKRIPMPDSSLTSLFWRTSPKQAAPSIRKLYDRDPEKAMAILRWSMRRDDAFDILVELTDRDRPRWLSPTLLMASRLGTEHALDFMKKERDGAGAVQGALDARIAELEKRRALGVTDGVSLGRYAWGHRSDSMTSFWGMSLGVVGKRSLCCDIEVPLGGDVQMKVEVACDGDTYKRMCEAAEDVSVTVHGLVSRTSVTGNRVTLTLEDARVELGGELAPTAELGPIPEEPLPGKEKSGCSCEVARGAPAHALWLAALAFGFARRRRRLGACP